MPLSCEVVEKKVVLGSPICRGWDSPDFGHTLSNRTQFRASGQFWLSSVQQARRVADEKRRRKKESLVKYKSVDNYVGRPNELPTLNGVQSNEKQKLVLVSSVACNCTEPRNYI